MLEYDESGFLIRPKGGTKVAGYVREGNHNAFSAGDQPDSIASYAFENGFEYVGKFEDAGRSGTNAHRPGLEASLAAAAAGDFEILIVTSFDRLARDMEHFIELRRKFSSMGVVVVETCRRTFAG